MGPLDLFVVLPCLTELVECLGYHVFGTATSVDVSYDHVGIADGFTEFGGLVADVLAFGEEVLEFGEVLGFCKVAWAHGVDDHVEEGGG